MKYIAKWGLYIPKRLWIKWKLENPNREIFGLVDKLICITEHGTICRKNLKDHVEKANKEGKNKDYSDGLSTGKPYYLPKKHKTRLRKDDMKKLEKMIEDKTATTEEKNLYKKWNLILKGV